MRKSLVPLVKEDSESFKVAPNLLTPGFSKRAKVFVGQVNSLRSSFVANHDYNSISHFFGGVTPQRAKRPGQGAEAPVTKREVNNTGNPVRDSEKRFCMQTIVFLQRRRGI